VDGALRRGKKVKIRLWWSRWIMKHGWSTDSQLKPSRNHIAKL